MPVNTTKLGALSKAYTTQAAAKKGSFAYAQKGTLGTTKGHSKAKPGKTPTSAATTRPGPKKPAPAFKKPPNKAKTVSRTTSPTGVRTVTKTRTSRTGQTQTRQKQKSPTGRTRTRKKTSAAKPRK